ncbi:MAG TPA: UDP-2,4-diacetamido-2,4,6-trideoxy-beta-L-altropyranose hydrolase [Opitutaceae bacterium]|nr:UDP-2,4-diacetamido-2,4,6-trideoxy-beta-L-altropyranose hydrolase [Opitutaceae bacterium]
MKPLLLRCEANATLGTGHALRCLALAQEWHRRGGRAVFAMSAPEPAIVERLTRGGFATHELRAEAGSAADAVETRGLAQRLEAEWTVVDGPAFGPEWERAWAEDGRLLRIDDNGFSRPFRADLLLNQNLGATAGDYPRAAADCRLLLGPAYALLRPEFLAMTRVERRNRILVTLGGSDPARATERMLAALEREPARDLSADFIIGGANPRRAELLAAIAAAAPRLTAVVAPHDLPTRFARAAFAVTAGGTTLYELALLRTPLLVLCTAENQRRTCEQFAAAGAARYLGWHEELEPDRLAEALAEFASAASLHAELAARAAALVDGRGAARVVDEMPGGAAR